MRIPLSIAAALVVCACSARAQQPLGSAELADAPSATMVKREMMIRPVPIAPPVKPAHAFADRKNFALIAVSLLGQTADAITTQRGLSHGRHEVNPIAKPFVDQGWAGQIGLAVIVNSAQLGVMYFAHRHGHHKLERALPLVIGFASGSAAYSNLQEQ